MATSILAPLLALVLALLPMSAPVADLAGTLRSVMPQAEGQPSQQIPPTVPIQQTQPTLLYLVKQLEQVIRVRLEEIVRPHGLTAPQYTALTVLELTPRLTTAELARRSFVTDQAMSDMVKSLLALGLVDRHRAEGDRRTFALILTGKGRSVIGQCRPRVAELEASMVSDLTARQIDAMRRATTSCRRALTRPRP